MIDVVNFADLKGKLKPNEQFLYEIERDQYELIKNLIAERKKKKLTQKDIAQITGMSQQAVSRIEQYDVKPSLINLLKYIKAIGLNINSIFNN